MKFENYASRQAILYGVLAVIGVLYVGDIGYRKLYQQPVDEAMQQADGLRERLKKQTLANAKSKRIGDTLEKYQQQSLPSNQELARSTYQAWLLKTVNDCQLSSPKVDSGDPSASAYRRQMLYNKFVFTVRARGNLQQVTQLLYAFYSADHLHKIQSLSLTPNAVSDQLDMALSIEALSLPGADRESELSTQTSDRLASPELSDYRTIASRNLFQMGGDSIGRQIHLSAITTDRLGRREAWFYDRRDDQTQRLKQGETLSIGALSATVVDIQDKSAVVVIDGQTFQVPMGASLAEAVLDTDIVTSEDNGSAGDTAANTN